VVSYSILHKWGVHWQEGYKWSNPLRHWQGLRLNHLLSTCLFTLYIYCVIHHGLVRHDDSHAQTYEEVSLVLTRCVLRGVDLIATGFTVVQNPKDEAHLSHELIARAAIMRFGQAVALSVSRDIQIRTRPAKAYEDHVARERPA